MHLVGNERACSSESQTGWQKCKMSLVLSLKRLDHYVILRVLSKSSQAVIKPRCLLERNPTVSVCFFTIPLSHVSLLQVRCFTPPSQAGCPCLRPQTAVCPLGASWPQWGSFIWPGGPAWTAVPQAGCLMAVSATRWPGLALSVEGASQGSTLSQPTTQLTTPQRYMMLIATEVLQWLLDNATANSITVLHIRQQ